MAEKENSVTRRSLLKLTAAAGVVGSLPVATHALASSIPGQTGVNTQVANHIHHWGPSDFEPYLDSLFSVDTGMGRKLQMKLTSVESLLTKDTHSEGECFALHFGLTSGTAVAQGTYTFEHRELGLTPLLVVPSATHPYEYTAVINHRKPR